MATVEKETGSSGVLGSSNHNNAPPSFTHSPSKHFDETPTQKEPGWKKFLSFIGPGFLVSLAYLDPGNLETDLQAGANHKFEGFLELKMKSWMRNLITRGIAITPSLIVSVIGGSAGAGKLIIISSMILSFELPFALIPLLKFSSSSTKMGHHKNSQIIIIICWILGLGIIGINIYYLITAFVGWLIHNNLPKVGNVFVGILVFPLMMIYILSIVYLMIRKDRVATFVDNTNTNIAHKVDNVAESSLP